PSTYAARAATTSTPLADSSPRRPPRATSYLYAHANRRDKKTKLASSPGRRLSLKHDEDLRRARHHHRGRAARSARARGAARADDVGQKRRAVADGDDDDTSADGDTRGHPGSAGASGDPARAHHQRRWAARRRRRHA